MLVNAASKQLVCPVDDPNFGLILAEARPVPGVHLCDVCVCVCVCVCVDARAYLVERRRGLSVETSMGA